MELLNVELEQESILETLSELAVNVGISDEIKQALLQCFQKVAWVDDQGQTYYDALYDALYPPVDLSSISCVYTQSGTVYDTDTLDSLKSDLVVTAHFDDYSTQTITAYTLSGTLAEGTSTITVSYGGKTTTFNVTVTHMDNSIYSWDFTQSVTDSKQGAVATLSGATQNSNGIVIDNSTNYIYLADVNEYGAAQFTFEVEFGNFVAANASGPVILSTAVDFSNNSGFWVVSNPLHWMVKTTSNSNNHFDNAYTDMEMFNNKTLKFVYDAGDTKTWKIYADGVLIITAENQYRNLNNRRYLGLYSMPVGSVIKKARIYEGIE